MQSLNILMITESFYPDGIGGAHSYVYNLGKSLIKKGHNVYIITIKMRKDMPDEETIEGMKVFRYDSVVSGCLIYIRRFLLSVMNAHRLFNNVVKKVKVDIINCHSPLPAFGVNLFFKHRNISRIFTFHSSIYKGVLVQNEKKKYSFHLMNELIFSLLKGLEGITLRACDKIIVLSGFSKKYILDTYYENPEKIVVIQGGVDSNKFVPINDKMLLRTKLNLPKDKIILVTARRLVARMGLENLILAIKHVSEKVQNVVLVILGDGFLKGQLKGLIKKERLESKVKLLGFVDFKMISAYYQASDIFILPSESDEWFGLVTLEALACGLPVLATPVGGSVEILSRFDKSLIFSAIGPDEMSQGIVKFIEHTKNILGTSKKCRQFILNNYSWEKTCEKIEELYFSSLRKK